MVKPLHFISGLAGNLMLPILPVGFSYLFLKESLLGIGVFHCLAVTRQLKKRYIFVCP